MKVEKVREKDGKLELLVELSVAEADQEIQRAALYELSKRGIEYDAEATVAPMDFLAEQLGQAEVPFVIDEAIMRRRAPFACTAAQVDIIGAPVYRCSEHAVSGKPFQYQLVCVPVPEYELEDYGPVSITVPLYDG